VRYEPHDKATWGLGGQAYTFDFDPNRIGNGSGFLVAGAGGSKTVCFLSICLEWSGSLVVHDPAREIAPQVCAYRESLGRTVVLLDPKATDHRGSVNVMEKFDSTSPDVQSAVEDLAATLALYDPATSDDWVAYSKDFIQLLLGAEVFEHAPAKDAKPTLRAVYGRFAKGPAWLSKEYIPGLAEHAGSLWVRQMAARFNGVGTPEGLAPETWTSITNKTATALGWLGNESLCALVSDSTMSLDDLPRGKLDVFIQLGKQKSSSMPARILVEAFVGAMKAADGHHDERCLFLLDEAHGLCKGGFEEVQWVLTEGRKFGLSVLLGLQSEKQLNDCFGDNGAAMWRDSSAIRGYACTRDYETAKRLSDAIGTYTALEYSDSENTSSSESEQEKQGGLFSQGSGKSRSASDSRGRSVKPVKRDLISPQEIMDLRDDVGIFLITGCKPAIGSRAISYRRKEMVAKLGANRFAAKAAARANGEA